MKAAFPTMIALALATIAHAQEDRPGPLQLEQDSIIPGEWIEEAQRHLKLDRANAKLPATPLFERDLVARLRRLIIAKQDNDDFKDFTAFDSRKDVPYEMVAIQGGTFLMGSPEDEAGRSEDEGPRREVTVSDFWMGKYETTWTQFQRFWKDSWRHNPRNSNGTPMLPKGQTSLSDWVSAPTTPYTPPEQGMGVADGFPVVNVTQHTANKFCQWLSAETGMFFRLPTEAEWEYACRAGTTGPYSCALEELDRYAILDPEQVRVGYEKVGTRLPNPWGLYDMHGNVMEWTVDAYWPDGYERLPDKDPWRQPSGRYPVVARGGSWYDDVDELRSARRTPSGRDFMIQDPQSPQSLWYLTEGIWLGFRIVRTRQIPTEEEMFAYWNCGAYYEMQEKSTRLPR